MNFILRLIPLPILMALAGLVALAAAGANAHYEWQKSIALENGLPATIDISQVGEVQEFPWYQEVVVTAQMDDDLTYVYWDEFPDGIIEYPIIFLFDPDHSGPVRQVLGAIAFDTSTEVDMRAYLESVQQGEGEHGAIFRLSGTPSFLGDISDDEILWAAEDLGVTLSENFLYLDPYFDGRERRLEAQPMLTVIAGGAGVALIWLAMIFQIIKRRMRHAAAERAAMGQVAKRGLVAAGAAAVGALAGGE